MKPLVYFTLALAISFCLCLSNSTGQCYDLFGISPEGGEYSAGAIYRTDENGNSGAVYSFYKVDAYCPISQFCKAADGKLYGLSAEGGSYRGGVLFEWDPATNEYIKKINFDFYGEVGYSPQGSLIQGKNGKFYGMTGANCVIFEWDPLTNMIIKKINFDDENGYAPLGSLVQAENGLIYGMTSGGGANQCGVLFEWNPETNVYAKKLDFDELKHGSRSQSTLIEADNGKLYGMTRSGGLYGYGVLFEWDPETNTFCKRFDFDGSENGSHPESSLIQADNGRLYGMTYDGGTHDKGVLFELDPVNKEFRKLLDFDDDKGGNPKGSLIRLENGKLAGVTYSSIFEWDPAAEIFRKRCDLSRTHLLPNSSITQAGNGKFYGFSEDGGIWASNLTNSSNFGVIYEWDTDADTCLIRLRFQEAENGSRLVSLITSDNGKLYGTANYGGQKDIGTLFEFDPATGSILKKVEFNDYEKGTYPEPLIKAANGKLYGSTNSSGEYLNFGTLYEWDPITELYSRHFTFEYSWGGNSLFEGDNNKIYVTSVGGMVFEWDPIARSFTGKHKFNSETELLVKDINGLIYGTTDGGDFNKGILFQWDPEAETIVKKLDFTDCFRINSLYQLSNNKFYGVTNIGSRGLFYEWDAETNASAVKFEINDLEYDNRYPLSKSLALGDNGKLYGTICRAGSGCYIFEWDPVNNIYKQKFSTNGVRYSRLVILKRIIASEINPVACRKYLSPSGKYSWTESGEYKDTIPSMAGCDSIITVNLTIMSVDTSVTQHQEVLTANADGAIYQWIDCGNGNVPVEGETRQTFTAGKSGNYAVIVTKNGCTDTSKCIDVTITDLRSGLLKSDITLYPNPNEGSFYINLGTLFPYVEIILTELDGRIIQTENYDNTRTINLKMDAAPGVYLVTIITANDRVVFKIMKK